MTLENVNIYIETTLQGPAKRNGHYMYLLEVEKDGKTYTKDGIGYMEAATENQLALTAIAEAAKRLTKPCSVRVVTRCDHVLNVTGNFWLQQWMKHDWHNAAGKPVKNKELWQQVVEAFSGHIVSYTCRPRHPHEEKMFKALQEAEKHHG